MFLRAFANIYQTKDTHQVIHLCKNEDHYDLLVVNKVPETATTNFDNLQVAEDEISENCHNFDTEWEEEFITVLFHYLSVKSSRSTFIVTDFPACQFVVHLPKYFRTWVKILPNFYSMCFGRKVIRPEKILCYLGNHNKNTAE